MTSQTTSPSSPSTESIPSLLPGNFPSSLVDNAFVVDFDLVLSIVIRTIIVTLFVFLAIRWMGHKGLGQLSMYELLILIGLGSAIGDPMIYRDLSIVQAFTAIVIVIAIFKVIDASTMKSKRFEKFAEGDPILLVKDGVYVEGGLIKAKISKKNLQASMRLKGIRDISEIDESYLEANGQISFLQKEKKRESE